MLHISKLSVFAGSKNILNDISFEINQGEVLAVVGPNGAGKSSLLKAILSVYPKKGEIYFNDQDLSKLSFKERAKIVAYLSQQTTMSFNLKAWEVVKLGAYPHRNSLSLSYIDQKINEIMILVDAIHLKEQDYFSLSGGESQRVQLARVLLQLNLVNDDKPKLLLLDEHINHLDLAHQHMILSSIRKLNNQHNLTVVMVLHDLNLVLAYADKALVLKKGELYSFGDTQEVITQEMIKDIYQMKFIRFDGFSQGIIIP